MSNTISRERWRQVKAIFQSAVEQDRESRQRFLAITCQDDPVLRAEVERLLASDEREPNFLEASPINFTNLVITEDSPESFVGTRVGPYRILKEIGRGGMGAVYLAKREDEFEKRVAIKIIKRGMDSDDMLRRFRNERQILAHLDHPNIARLLDGGTTTEGLPYFVMEYVEGWGIDEYCDEHELTLHERLELFQQVCAAVSYAHQHLAIHRDIKPSNILVTTDGTPKLLDFGIAKLLSPDASDASGTVTGLKMMTPEYASPEQARGDAGISTASDVYSLGIVLYELLTGQRPYLFPNRRPEVVARVIWETEPEKPSAVGARQRAGGSKNSTHGDGKLATGDEQLAQQKERPTASRRRQLRGDLDNIVLMALRKDPSRRYNSVDHLSQDIRRHLEGLPVIARADTFHYRASKFIQRNKVASLAAGLVTLAICVGIAATLYQTRVAKAERARAEQQRVLAEQRFNEVRQLANAVVFKYHDAIETLPGSTQVREMLVKDALAYLDRLSQNASADRSLHRELALAYIKVGDVQGRAHVANLGDTAGALRSYLKAVELFEKLNQSDSADAETQENLRDAYQKVGTHYVFRTQQWREGHDFAMKAVSVGETLVAHDPTSAKYRRDLARTYVYAGDAVVFFGGYAEEVRFFRKALEILEDVYARDPKSVEVRRTVIIALQRLGTRLEYWADTLKEQNVDRSEIDPKYQEAISRHLNWFRIVESLIADQPQNATFQRYLGSAYMNIGGATARSGDGKRALPYLEKSFSVMKSIADRDPANQEAQRDVSEAEEYLGIGYDSLGDTRRALQHYLRAIAILEPLNTADRLNVEFQEQRFRLQKIVGNLSLKAGDYPRALRAYTSALRFAEEFPEAISPQLKLFGLGEAHEHLGRYYAALASSRRTSSSARSANWRLARDYYELALSSFHDAQQRQMLNAAYDYKPALLRREIAQCDAALAN